MAKPPADIKFVPLNQTKEFTRKALYLLLAEVISVASGILKRQKYSKLKFFKSNAIVKCPYHPSGYPIPMGFLIKIQPIW